MQSSERGNIPAILRPRQRCTIVLESEDVVEVSEEDLAAFNNLVQCGYVEVVRIVEGMPYYRIATEYAGPLDPTQDLDQWARDGDRPP